MGPLFGKSFNLLATMLDYRSERHKVISSNIANLDTPGYKASDYVFKDDLKKAMDIRLNLTRTDEKHFPNAPDGISRNDFKKVTSDENMDLDTEMANLSENHLMYNLTAEIVARKFKAIRNVLSETK